MLNRDNLHHKGPATAGINCFVHGHSQLILAQDLLKEQRILRIGVNNHERENDLFLLYSLIQTEETLLKEVLTKEDFIRKDNASAIIVAELDKSNGPVESIAELLETELKI
jgi:hypothetical protein